MTHPPTNDANTCPVCGRPLCPGPSVERHHTRPKSKGGSETVALHAVCHRMLHKVFTEQKLASSDGDFAVLLADPQMQSFVRWVAKKPADFVDRPRTRGRTPYHKAHR